jgi:hypothetical protein
MANASQENARAEGERLSSDPDDLMGREPLLLGLYFYDPAEPRRDRVYKRGGCLLGAEQRVGRLALLRLVLAAARHLNHDVPDLFTPDSAEVFYAEHGLEEVRLEGRCVMGVDLDGEICYEPVTIGAKVGFTPGGDGRIVLSPGDERREHLAVRRKGGALWVSWDVMRDVSGPQKPGAAYALIMIEFSLGGADGAGGAGANRIDAGTLFQEEADLRGVGGDGLKKRLLLPEPVEMRSPRAIRLSGELRMLTYVYEEDQARRHLAQYYAMSADFSDHEIRAVAREMSVPFDRAKAMLFLKHRQDRDAFVEKSLRGYHESAVRLLEDVFVRRLTRELNSIALAQWDNPDLRFSKTPEEIRKELRQELNEETGRRLGLPGRRRQPGTHPRMGREKVSARRAGRLWQIRAAMAEIFSRKLSGRKIDDRALSTAEDAVTQAAVLRELKIDRKTLNRWLTNGRSSFKLLKDFVVKEETHRHVRKKEGGWADGQE